MYTYINKYIYMHKQVYIYLYVCMYIYIVIPIYIYTYTFIYICVYTKCFKIQTRNSIAFQVSFLSFDSRSPSTASITLFTNSPSVILNVKI